MTPAPDPVLPTHADVLSALHRIRRWWVSLAQCTPLLDQLLVAGLFIWARRPLAVSRRRLTADGLKTYRRLVALEKTAQWTSIAHEPFERIP